jgi:hypothetical protein
MYPKLFDRATSESVTSGNEDAQTILEQPEADFGKVCRFSHAIHADEGDGVRVRLIK